MTLDKLMDLIFIGFLVTCLFSGLMTTIILLDNQRILDELRKHKPRLADSRG
jgi:hypothetical protein